MSRVPLQPTWYGYVATDRDALRLFEACLNGTLQRMDQRPYDCERSHLIKSGNVFIFDETSGIKKWTDGISWTQPSRLGNFKIYRELERKRARGRKNRNSRPGEPYPTTLLSTRSDGSRSGDSRKEVKNLIGPLIDSYGCKEDGLVKKTMSVNVHGALHRLVCYHKVEDVLNKTLKPPADDSKLANLEPRRDLVEGQNFMVSLDVAMDKHDDGLSGEHSCKYPVRNDPIHQALTEPQYRDMGEQYRAGIPRSAPIGYQLLFCTPTVAVDRRSLNLKTHDNKQNQLPQPGYEYRFLQKPHTPSLGQQPLSTPVNTRNMVKLGNLSLKRTQGVYYAPANTGQSGTSNQGTPLRGPELPGADDKDFWKLMRTFEKFGETVLSQQVPIIPPTDPGTTSEYMRNILNPATSPSL